LVNADVVAKEYNFGHLTFMIGKNMTALDDTVRILKAHFK